MTITPQRQHPAFPCSPPVLTSKNERLVPAADHLWRVEDARTAGRILGHLRVVVDSLGTHYRAERLHLATRSFRFVGDFWRADDAVQVLRNG